MNTSTVYQRDAHRNFFYRLNQHATVTVGRTIAILVDVDSGKLLMHGAPAFMAAKRERLIAARREKGEAANIVLFSNSRWTPDYLNTLIAFPDLASEWWSRMVQVGNLRTDLTMH